MSDGEDHERRVAEAAAVGLLALTVLLGLALVPPAVGVERELAGPAGDYLHRVLTGAFGAVALAVLLPPLAWGLALLGAAGRSTGVRWSVLAAGLLALVPPAGWLAVGRGSGTAAGGALGRTAGGFLFGVLGYGAHVLVGAALLVLLILTLGWSASRGLGRLAEAIRGAGVSLLSAARRGGEWLQARAKGAPSREGSSDAEGSSPWQRSSEAGVAEGGSAGSPSEPGTETAAVAGGNGSRGDGRDDAPTGGVRPPSEDGGVSLTDPGDLDQTELPPLELLSTPEREATGLSEGELEELGQVLVEKLETFNVEGRIEGWTTGPVVTQFEVVPAPGVKVGQISALSDDLALALKAPSVRIVAPIPGRGAVGVEVPNPEPQVVRLREVLESRAYRGSRATLPLALGRDLAGEPYCTDLSRMPHLLIAGATGSGKSVCINTIITSLLYRYPPAELRFLMVDPKMVELSVYDDLPHLRHPVVTDNDEAAAVLKWAVYEMNRRYALLGTNASRNLEEFNQRVEDDEVTLRDPHGSDLEAYTDGRLPYVVIVIDELADLMMTVQGQVEEPLAMLAQKARAVGIHLVIATQRPSVNVITGLIKANFPSRIAFRVASKTDSRTILDQNGAESLLGNGDMLFLPPGESDPIRIQGAFLGSKETERLVKWYRKKTEEPTPERDEEGERDILDFVEEKEAEEARVDVVEEVLEDRDELFRQAAEVVITHDSGSTSLLQRRLKIGYGRAARIIDQLHHAGVVGPPQGSQPREVLVGLEELDEVVEE
jgi:S-DNA-T family DNA segregation ATPase FtsK/SpoIIIE